MKNQHGWPIVALGALLAILTCPTNTNAAAFRLAVMGDSISAGSGVSGGSPNWVSQLNATKAFTMQNKAVGGATSFNVVSSQLPSVVTLATSKKLDGAVLIIGGNDVTSDVFNVLGDPDAFSDAYFNNVKTVIDAIAAAGPTVHQVFGNIPDITVTPKVQAYGKSINATPALYQLMRDAISAANTKADAYALSHGVPVVDLYGFSQAVTSNFTLGGHLFATPFAPDGYHPGVYAQGLLANAIDTAFNLNWGLSLPLLTDQKIVQNAGFTPDSGSTYFNVRPFVILAIPEPASLNLIVIAAMGLVFLRQVRTGRRRANQLPGQSNCSRRN